MTKEYRLRVIQTPASSWGERRTYNKQKAAAEKRQQPRPTYLAPRAIDIALPAESRGDLRRVPHAELYAKLEQARERAAEVIARERVAAGLPASPRKDGKVTESSREVIQRVEVITGKDGKPKEKVTDAREVIRTINAKAEKRAALERSERTKQESRQKAEEAKKRARETKKQRTAAQEVIKATLGKSWDRAERLESSNMDIQAKQGEPNGSGFTMGWARILMSPRSHVKDALSVKRSTGALTADFHKTLTVIRDNGMDPENRKHGALEWAVDALKAEAETPVGLGMKWLMKKFPYVNLFVNGAVLVNQWSSSDLAINKGAQGINDVISTLIPLAAFVSDSPTFSAASDRQQDRIVYGRVFGAEDMLGLEPGDNRELAAYQRRVATAFVSALEQQPSHLAMKGHELGTQLQNVARPLLDFEKSVVDTGKRFGVDVHQVLASVVGEVAKTSGANIDYKHVLATLDTLKATANRKLDEPQSLLSYTVNLKDVARGMVGEENLRVAALEAQKPSIFKRGERHTHKKQLKAARLAQAKWTQAGQVADDVLRVYQKASQLVKQAA